MNSKVESARSAIEDQTMIHYMFAKPEYLQDVYDLYMEPTANPYLTYDPMEIEQFKKIYEELLLSNTLFVVRSGESIVASYRIIPKTFRQSQTWYLGGFVVHPACKGEGIGYKVLQHIQNKGKEDNIRRIELTVAIENEAAIRLYQKAGYEIEGTIKSSYRLGGSGPYFDEYLMALII